MANPLQCIAMVHNVQIFCVIHFDMIKHVCMQNKVFHQKTIEQGRLFYNVLVHVMFLTESCVPQVHSPYSMTIVYVTPEIHTVNKTEDKQ